ncbi:MAG: DUF3137 domain-containing protein [Acholeplasma sp.]|nr:DUF3137 domain-containing protein [Acholeplasma sp.]
MDFKRIKRKKLKYEIIFIFLGVIWLIALIIGLAIGIGGAILFEDADVFEFGLLPFALVSGIIYGVYRKFKKQSLKFKKMFVSTELKRILPNVTYSPEEGLAREDVFETELITHHLGFESEDLITGNISSIDFKASDVYVSQYQRGKHTRAGNVYFKGQFFIIDIKEKSEEMVYVIPKNNKFFNVKKEYIKPELEWVKFNKQFNVYSKTNQATFKVVKPRFMERMANANDLERLTAFAFYHNKLYVAINTNIDTFDLRLYRSINKRFFEEIRRQIYFVKEIIETLK